MLEKSGTLVILIPTALINDYKDPLTIGDFVEKYERENRRDKEYMDKNMTLTLLRDWFNKVEEKHIVHMTVFRASDKRVLHS